MSGVDALGWLGFALLITAWVPQTVDTIKAGKTEMNLGFILMYASSCIILTIYAILSHNAVFITLNALLTIGSGINLYYKFFPDATDN